VEVSADAAPVEAPRPKPNPSKDSQHPAQQDADKPKKVLAPAAEGKRDVADGSKGVAAGPAKSRAQPGAALNGGAKKMVSSAVHTSSVDIVPGKDGQGKSVDVARLGEELKDLHNQVRMIAQRWRDSAVESERAVAAEEERFEQLRRAICQDSVAQKQLEKIAAQKEARTS